MQCHVDFYGGEDHWEIAETFMNMCVFFTKCGILEKAEEYLQKSIEIRRAVFGEIDEEIADYYAQMEDRKKI